MLHHQALCKQDCFSEIYSENQNCTLSSPQTFRASYSHVGKFYTYLLLGNMVFPVSYKQPGRSQLRVSLLHHHPSLQKAAVSSAVPVQAL